jgi:hypothetical protein
LVTLHPSWLVMTLTAAYCFVMLACHVGIAGVFVMDVGQLKAGVTVVENGCGHVRTFVPGARGALYRCQSAERGADRGTEEWRAGPERRRPGPTAVGSGGGGCAAVYPAGTTGHRPYSLGART